MPDKTCKDCGEDMGSRGDNHDHCSRCIAIWHTENEVPDNAPCGDWDDDRPKHED